jgi:hypothetical protein
MDVSLGTTLSGRLQGNRSRMVWTADENQSFGQAPHGCAVERCFFHSKCPRVVVYAGHRSSSPSSYILKPNLNRVSRCHDQWGAPRPRRRYYEGEKALPGAFDAVDRMRHAGLSLRFVTNTTRMTKHMVLQRLARLGFGVTESELFTPARGAREWLARNDCSPLLLVHQIWPAL